MVAEVLVSAISSDLGLDRAGQFSSP